MKYSTYNYIHKSIILRLASLLTILFLTSCSVQTGTAQPEVAVSTLAAAELPSYTKHIEPIFAQACVSCHSGLFPAGGYLMTSYEAVLNTGNNSPNVCAADYSSNVLRMLHGETIRAGGPMPPAQPLSPEQIRMIERWIEVGALR